MLARASRTSRQRRAARRRGGGGLSSPADSTFERPDSRSRELAMPLVNAVFLKALQRLPHAKAQHEAFPDLHGIAPGGPNARLVVDAHADQRRGRGRHGLIDQALKVLFVCRPGAVDEAASNG